MNTLEQAMKYYEKGEIKKVDEVFANILEKEPNNLEVLFMQAKLKLNQNKLDDALLAINKVLDVDKRNPNFYLIKGNILARMGKNNETIKTLKKGLKINPNMHRAYVLLGHLYYSQNERNKARLNFELAMKTVPEDPEAETNLAKIMLEEGNVEQAIKVLKVLERKHPEDISIQMIMGQAMLDNGAYNFAEKYFERILEKEPHYTLAMLYLGISYIYKGKFKQAEKEISLFNQEVPHHKDGIAAIGLYLFHTNKAGEAINYLRQATKGGICPNYWKQTLIEAYVVTGNFEPAINYYKTQKNIKSNFRLAEIYEIKQENTKAISFYKKVLDKNQNSIQVFIGLSRCYLLEGKYSKSKKYSKKGLELNPENPELVLLNINSLLYLEETKKALKKLEKVDYLKLDATFKNLYRITHGLILDNLKKYDKAFAVFTDKNKQNKTRITKINKITEQELKIVQNTKTEIVDSIKDPVFLMGNMSSLMPSFVKWLHENKVIILNDRLISKGREDVISDQGDISEFSAIDDNLVRIKRKQYKQKIKALLSLSIDDYNVVDCLFANPKTVAKIKKYFPKATILFLTRDTPDIWLNQRAFNEEQVDAINWNEVKNQILTMGLNVIEIETDKWIENEKETFDKITKVFDKKLPKYKETREPFWKKTYFKKGHWKNYKDYLGK